MAVDPSTTKFVIKASFRADGVVEKPDIVGAVFGQTEGLLGNELDLRDLQKSARIGRLEVEIEQKGGKTTGTLTLPSAMEKVESAIIAAGIETIDRIGPAKAEIKIESIEDARFSKRQQVATRAKQLLSLINEDPGQDSTKIAEEVRDAVQVADIEKFRGTRLWCGPNVEDADSIILVEGRNDVLNLLKFGIRNALGVEGTNVPKEVQDLTREKTTTIFVDGDRGGELIAKELLQTCEVDFVARAPATREVEELPHKLVMKCLKNKLTADQFINQMGIRVGRSDDKADDKKPAQAGGGRGRSGGRPQADQKDSGDDKKPSRRGRGGRGRKGGDRETQEDRPARQAPAASDDKGGDKAGDKAGDTADDKKPAPKQERKAAHDPRAAFRDALAGLSGTLKAVILDKDGATIKTDLPVRELADTLKSTKGAVQTVVFDGVITQRLLDIAAERNIATVVGVKMGNVSKVPEAVEILTRDDLS